MGDARALVLCDDEHVGEVREARTVGCCAGEADLLSGVEAIGPDDAPGGVELRLEHRAFTPPAPVRLGREPLPHHVTLDAGGGIVDLVVHVLIVRRSPARAGW